MIRINNLGPVEDVALATSPFGKPFYWVHCFRIGNLLVDTGHFWMREKFGKWLRTRVVEQLFLTHHHEDHAGNGEFAAQVLGIKPQAHPAAIEYLRRGPTLWPFQLVIWGPCRPVDAQPAGATIDSDLGSWLVIHTPGHSPDHAVLLNQQEGILAAGDFFVGSSLAFLRDDEDFNALIESTQIVLTYDFDVALCGLRGIVKGAKSKLNNKLQWMQEVRDKVLDLHHKGIPDLVVARRVFGPEGTMTLVTTGRYSKLNFVRSILGSQ